ncbi:MAG: hypothetical protein HQ567_25530 [Candidatus Nealsonbacteria bacterium]|nr:hypothetical protein [Candidatus Nealsonbacteria bacterium]
MSKPAIPTTPVHWRFLAGGTETLRLTLSGAALLLGGGMVLAGVGSMVAALDGRANLPGCLASAAASTAVALLLAALAARWLGRRIGTLAGLALLTCFGGLAGRIAPAEMLLCLSVTTAMAAFAVANVPGRLPLVDRPWPRLLFYAATGTSLLLAGVAGPVLIGAGCLSFALLCVDTRSLRFFAHLPGLALFGLLAVGCSVAPESWLWCSGSSHIATGTAIGWPGSLTHTLGRLATAGLPWTPLAVLTAALGLHGGHHATPIWRLFGCWLAATVAIVATGVFHSQIGVAVSLPPLVVIAAAALAQVPAWWRRMGLARLAFLRKVCENRRLS